MAIINAITDTWNNAGTVFTAIKMTVTNTASASGSKLIDLLVGASSKFSVDKNGAVVVAGSIAMPAGTEGAPSIWFGQSNTGIFSAGAARVTISAGGGARLECASQQVLVEAAAKLGWVSAGSASGGTFQVGFIKDSNTQIGVYSAGSVYADLKARNLIATGNIVANATSTTGIFEAYLNPANTYSTEKALFGPAITVANYGSGYAGLWLGGTVAQNAPSTSNYTLVGDGSTTILNVPNAGTLHFAVFGTIKATLNNSGNFGIGINATQRLEVAGNIQNSGYQRTTPVTVATLTAAATAGAGARHFVTDSSVAASGNFGAVVAAGGANIVPVFCDGTDWRIG